MIIKSCIVLVMQNEKLYEHVNKLESNDKSKINRKDVVVIVVVVAVVVQLVFVLS